MVSFKLRKNKQFHLVLYSRGDKGPHPDCGQEGMRTEKPSWWGMTEENAGSWVEAK